MIPLDLDELERLDREASTAPWVALERVITSDGHPVALARPKTRDIGAVNRDLIVATRNALPTLLAAAASTDVRPSDRQTIREALDLLDEGDYKAAAHVLRAALEGRP